MILDLLQDYPNTEYKERMVLCLRPELWETKGGPRWERCLINWKWLSSRECNGSEKRGGLGRVPSSHRPSRPVSLHLCSRRLLRDFALPPGRPEWICIREIRYQYNQYLLRGKVNRVKNLPFFPLSSWKLWSDREKVIL